jgi:hypothetical protein
MGGPPPPAAGPARPRPGGASLLEQINAGTQLKSRAPAPKKAPDARGGLLDAIANRTFALKKVVKTEEEPVAVGGLLGTKLQGNVMDILARRAAIEGDSDEDSTDSEWD